MTIKEIYKDLDYTVLHDVNNSNSDIDFVEFRRLGIDKVYLSGEHPAIFFKEVKQFNDVVLKEIAQVHHLAWNYRRVMFLIIVSPTEIKIYNCNKKPFNYEAKEVNIEKELKKLELISCEWNDVENLKIIKELFSRIAVDSGLLWTTENVLREKIDVQQRIDRYLVTSLLNAAKELKKTNLDDEMIHSLLMRSIFVMYLEDKGAANETKLYTQISKDAQSYLDILESKTSTYILFKKVEEHFNGNVFPLVKGEDKKVTKEHLQIIQKCLIDGDLSGKQKLFTWRLFRFDIIQIELLSEIYENFLEEFKEHKKEEAGQYYTPPSLVELILNEKLPTKNETNYQVKVLDPACGSGIFLVESFKRLVKRWKNANPNKQIEFKDLRDILKDNIFGIEYDRLAIRVTAFSLYLAIVEQLNPKTLWSDKRYKFPHLIYDPQDKDLENQGRNLLRADTIGEVSIQDIPKMDLIVGNPPFGSKIKLKSIKDYCINHEFGQDMVIPFLRKAIDFAANGSIALIFNTKVLTNTEKPFQNFRKWLFNETYVEKVYNLSIFRKAPKSFGGQLFTSAVGPVSIVFYQNTPPEMPTSTIEYWAPKTYVKSSLVEGVIIDSTDIKFLPRDECKKPNSKIWKIGMWGSYEDFKFISKLNQFSSLIDFINENDLKKGLGLQFLDESTKNAVVDNEIPKLPYIKPGAIQRFHTKEDSFENLMEGLTIKSIKKYKEHYKIPSSSDLKKINVFRRLGNKDAFNGPHVLIKEGLSNKKLCASYIEESCSFNSKVLGITGQDINALKAITCFVNSDIATYYLFLISASIGIEREEIKPNELYELPFAFSNESFIKLGKYIDKIKDTINKNYPLAVDVSSYENSINKELYCLFNLSENEQILISDFITYSLGLIFAGNNSIALKPSDKEENYQYALFLCNELNKFLNSRVNASADIFEIDRRSPLNMIKITLGKGEQKIRSSSADTFHTHLSEIDKYLIKKESKNIYIKKQVKYYDGDCIYIIKPNQKRFWTRSTAINDAKELIGEILGMK